MPTYEYQCKNCNYKFEAFQQITEEPLKSCPRCQGPIKRLIGAGAGFIFKGSGFYTTDYRSKEYKDREKQDRVSKAPSCPAAADNQVCKKCPANKDG